MQPRMIILSDLYGFLNASWLDNYVSRLKSTFDLQVYDCCELAGIDKKMLNHKELHAKFIHGGLDQAVKQLLKEEKDSAKILAFSIGGSIGWKACLKGLKVDHFYGVSSTRIRLETQKPEGNIHLFYGQNDRFQPSDQWSSKMNLKVDIMRGKGHEMYKDPDVAKFLYNQIIGQSYG